MDEKDLNFYVDEKDADLYVEEIWTVDGFTLNPLRFCFLFIWATETGQYLRLQVA